MTIGVLSGTLQYEIESLEKEATVVDCGVARDGWSAIIGRDGRGGKSVSNPIFTDGRFGARADDLICE